jgi:hypothetical protein
MTRAGGVEAKTRHTNNLPDEGAGVMKITGKLTIFVVP